MAKDALSLYELNRKLKQGIEGLFPFPVWIVAEISEIKSVKHCYLELIERDKVSDKIIAKSRATIWGYTYNMLKPYFETTTGYELSAGLKILVQVEVQFSELYGFSLNVRDIDPNYTLGDLEQRKQRILQQLEDEGILHMNKELDFPKLPKNIAVISSEKAAGYQDFQEQLHNNSQGYTYRTHLYPALMQGEQVTQSIINALEQIYANEMIFDVVVIIRGGGSVSDLSCFDDYELAANIAQFPLPILTGIGHDKDKSVVDEVAYSAFKTPTAVADFLVNCLQQCEDEIEQFTNTFIRALDERITREHHRIERCQHIITYTLPANLRSRHEQLENKRQKMHYLIAQKFNDAKIKHQQLENRLERVCSQFLAQKDRELADLQSRFIQSSELYLSRRKRDLAHKSKVLTLISPQRLLDKGYSITTCNGKVITDATQLKTGDNVVTQVAKGEFRATVK